jgi:hypothetical protein
MLLPRDADAPAVLGAVLGAFAPAGGFDELQTSIFDAVARQVYGLDPDAIRPLTAAELLEAEPDDAERRHAIHLMVVLELVEHPVRDGVDAAIERYAGDIGVAIPILAASREFASEHYCAMYLDLQRSSWITEQALASLRTGTWYELLRSKLSYEGVVADRAIARKWAALRDCAPGTWGGEVAAFYGRHRFPFPGERHGISELGALHDWVHVLSDYDATPEGEIDVFAFIASTLEDDKGVVLLAITLGIFQNDSIHRVAGKKVKIARADTLAEPGAVDHLADALRRGHACTVDVMGGIELFDYRDLPLAEVRERFNVPPRAG